MKEAIKKLALSMVNSGVVKQEPKKKLDPDDYTGCAKFFVTIYFVIKFFISNSDTLMDTDT